MFYFTQEAFPMQYDKRHLFKRNFSYLFQGLDANLLLIVISHLSYLTMKGD